jgi:Ni/Co efflux regulator RcnB
MFKKIRTAALSAIIGLGTLAAAPATAQADSFYFGISPNGPSFGFHSDSSRRWDRNRRDHRRSWDRCSPREALRKADRMGVNRAYVRGANHRVIRIGGRKRGHRVAITFGKSPNCPVIAWR